MQTSISTNLWDGINSGYHHAKEKEESFVHTEHRDWTTNAEASPCYQKIAIFSPKMLFIVLFGMWRLRIARTRITSSCSFERWEGQFMSSDPFFQGTFFSCMRSGTQQMMLHIGVLVMRIGFTFMSQAIQKLSNIAHQQNAPYLFSIYNEWQDWNSQYFMNFGQQEFNGNHISAEYMNLCRRSWYSFKELLCLILGGREMTWPSMRKQQWASRSWRNKEKKPILPALKHNT